MFLLPAANNGVQYVFSTVKNYPRDIFALAEVCALWVLSGK